MSGGIYHAGVDGPAEQVLDLHPGSADIGIMPADRVVLVPMMNEGEVVAYRVE
jgi:hypothetical protein